MGQFLQGITTIVAVPLRERRLNIWLKFKTLIEAWHKFNHEWQLGMCKWFNEILGGQIPTFDENLPENKTIRVILTHYGLVTQYGQLATEIWVNIGSGNGLLPEGTKPLPEPMLTDLQWSPVTFILRQFHKRCLNRQSLKSVWKLHV